MVTILKNITFCLLAFCFLSEVTAQENKLTEKFKEETITRIGQLVKDNYVFPEVAEATATHLVKKLQEGRFMADTSLATFARSLTEEVQSINHDKHMRVRAGLPNRSPGAGNSNDGGFKEVKLIDGSIGYIDMRMFLSTEVAGPIADEHMKTLADAKLLLLI